MQQINTHLQSPTSRIHVGFLPNPLFFLSKRVQFETQKAPESLIHFLSNHGFSQTQIRSFIQKCTNFLLCNPEKSLLPQFNFFYSKGLSSSELAALLPIQPYVLRRGLNSYIFPNFNFFKNLVGSDDDKVLFAYKLYDGILYKDFKSLTPFNISLLREHGVPELHIMSLLVNQPRVFAAKHDKFNRVVQEVKEEGFNPQKCTFLEAVSVKLQTSKPILERKSNVYKKWGWSPEQILPAFTKWPKFMQLSESSVTAVMDFLVNKMGLSSSYVAERPKLLSYSLVRRIVPRCSVLEVLVAKGLIKDGHGVHAMIAVNEDKFFKKYVTCYKDEAPGLMKLYQEKLSLSK